MNAGVVHQLLQVSPVIEQVCIVHQLIWVWKITRLCIVKYTYCMKLEVVPVWLSFFLNDDDVYVSMNDKL